MNAIEFKNKLIELDACSEAMVWAEGKTLQEAWNTCQRGDWMLWMHERLHPDRRRERALTAGLCVDTVRHLITNEKCLVALDTCIRYGRGNATEEELLAASYAESDAERAASDAAIYAERAASYAEVAAYYATRAASDAARAASDAARYAARAESDAARAANRAAQAEICRENLTIDGV